MEEDYLVQNIAFPLTLTSTKRQLNKLNGLITIPIGYVSKTQQ